MSKITPYSQFLFSKIALTEKSHELHLLCLTNFSCVYFSDLLHVLFLQKIFHVFISHVKFSHIGH